MAQYTEFGHKAFRAVGAIGQWLRVKGTRQSTGEIQIDVAGVTDRELGVATRPAFNALDFTDVKLRTANGTVQMVAAASFNAMATVYTAAAGKISGTQATGALLVGHAMQDASGNNSIVEVLRFADVG